MAGKTRSPNYPALDLAAAVEGIKRVYDAEGNRRTSSEDVAKALGHQSLSGNARTKVSALRKYGLLEPQGDGLKVSNEALSVINLPREDPEHVEALRNAALRPTLFAELSETYGDTPPSDGVLRNYLLKKEFSPRAADEVIRLYRSTMDLVSSEPEDYTAADEPVDEQQEAQVQQTQRTAGAAHPDAPSASAPVDQGSFEEFFTIPIKNTKIRLMVDGEVTPGVLESFGQFLNFVRENLPDSSAESSGEADTVEDAATIEEDSASAEGSVDSPLGETVGENGHHSQ